MTIGNNKINLKDYTIDELCDLIVGLGEPKFRAKQIFKWLKKVPGISKFIYKIENRAMGKSDQIKKYEFWGLVIFVGIPLPGTGAWTGSLIAALLEVDIKKAVVAELVGVFMATVIMSIVSYGLLGVILG